MTIGRDPDCSISAPDEEMARRHATLEHLPDGGLHIRDLGSMNRILVNKREIKDARLLHGDMVEIGRTRFLVQALVQAEVDGPGEATPRRRQWRAVGIAVVLVLAAVVAANVRTGRGVAREGGHQAVEPLPGAAVADESPTSQSDVAVSEDLRLVREDLAAIRESVRALTNRTQSKMSNTGPGPALRDVVQEKASAMFSEARAAIEDGNAIKGDQLLAGVQVLEPRYAPAFEERAWLYERRGMPEQAIQQWSAILDMNPSPELFQKAVGERLRISREKETAGSTLVRVVGADQHKVLTAADQDEMRILRIGLKQRSEDLLLDPELVRVEVAFYDEDPEDGSVFPTRVIVPHTVLRPDSPWSAKELKTVSATYMVPKGMRGSSQYYGYVIRVYYNDQLQDSRARPKTLLEANGGKRAAAAGGGS